jgi:hypothetical protein
MEKLPNGVFNQINQRLKDNFGNTEDKANYRLVWADDEKERRTTLFTKDGLQLLYPEVKEMRKYPDIRERYVLERLIENYDFENLEDGKPVARLIYQAIWNFEVVDGNAQRIGIAPNYGACKFIVETVLNAIEHPGATVKYKEDGLTQEAHEQRISELQQELFGDETAISDALGRRQGVAYGPGSSPNSSKGMMK